MTVTVVVGGQYGSEGKGKVCAHLAATGGADIMIRCGGPNSGHTVHTKERRYQLRQVPAGFLNKTTRLLLAPSALVDPAVFLDEVALCELDAARIGIDRNAGVIERSDSDVERNESLQARLGSTGVGMGAAVSRRVIRDPQFRTAANVPELRPFITNVADELKSAVREDRSIVVEGTQGFGLSLYHTEEWPYCTSRDTTAHSFLGEAGLGVRDFDVILAIRTHPIRVAGNSGPLANEITWEDVRQRSGYPEPIAEYTTTTKRLRRVGEFHWDVVLRAIQANQPSQIALHGTDYVDFRNKFAKSVGELSQSARDFITTLANRTGVPVTLIGTGPAVNEIIDLRASSALAPAARRSVGSLGATEQHPGWLRGAAMTTPGDRTARPCDCTNWARNVSPDGAVRFAHQDYDWPSLPFLFCPWCGTDLRRLSPARVSGQELEEAGRGSPPEGVDALAGEAKRSQEMLAEHLRGSPQEPSKRAIEAAWQTYYRIVGGAPSHDAFAESVRAAYAVDVPSGRPEPNVGTGTPFKSVAGSGDTPADAPASTPFSEGQNPPSGRVSPEPTQDEYEYRTTTGQRKAWDGLPELSEEGWEECDPSTRQPVARYKSWERYEYHEERTWRRKKVVSPTPNEQAGGEAEGEAQRAALIAMLDEALARPNDWPLDDSQVGFWIPRQAIIGLRDLLASRAAPPPAEG